MGNVSSGLDYPLKNSLCISWIIMFVFLIINALVKKVLIFGYIKKRRTPMSNEIYSATRNKKKWRYKNLPIDDKDKYLIKYETLIYNRLSKILPNDISLIVIGYYIPNNFIYSKDESDHIEITDKTTIQIEEQSVPETVQLQMQHKKIRSKTNNRKKKNKQTNIPDKNNISNKNKKRKKHMNKQIELSSTLTNTDEKLVEKQAFISIKQNNSAFKNKMFDSEHPLTDFNTFEKWCNDNDMEDDIDRKEELDEWKRKNPRRRKPIIPKYGTQLMNIVTRIMDRYYLPEYNKNYVDDKMEQILKIVREKDHIWRLGETVYVLIKNIMMFVSTIIMLQAFIEWQSTQRTSYLRFIGFIILFHYHPSITSINMMRWIKLQEYGYGVMPCAAPIMVPLVLLFKWINGEERNHTPTTLYYDGYLKTFTFVNYFICVYGLWIVAIPFVFFGGFWFIHIMWAVYLGIGVLLCCIGGFTHLICTKCLDKDRWANKWGAPSGLWMLAFFYHTTGLMYIIGAVFYGRSSGAWV
eukprot:376931_1